MSSSSKFNPDTLAELARHLLGDRAKGWRFTSTHSPISDSIEVLVRPDILPTVFRMNGEKIARLLEFDRREFASWLYTELTGAQDSYISRLAQTLNVRLSTDPPVKGKCHYCGAPYHEKP